MKANSNSEIIEEDLKSTEKLCNQPLFQEYENQCYMDAGAKIWYKKGIFWVRHCFQSRVKSCSFLLHPSMLIPQLHNIWLTKKGHYRVMLYLIIFCFFFCIFFLSVLHVLHWEYFELETDFKVGWTAVVFCCTHQCWYINYITYDWPRKASIELCSIWLSFVFCVFSSYMCWINSKEKKLCNIITCNKSNCK